MRHFIWIYGRGWLLLMAPFVRFRRRGFDTLDLSSPVIFVVNHQSFFDTYCMGLLPVFDVTFAVRAWPFRMVWYRWFMRLAGYLDVESTRWEEIESAGRAVLDGGGHLLFFPRDTAAGTAACSVFTTAPSTLRRRAGGRLSRSASRAPASCCRRGGSPCARPPSP